MIICINYFTEQIIQINAILKNKIIKNPSINCLNKYILLIFK